MSRSPAEEAARVAEEDAAAFSASTSPGVSPRDETAKAEPMQAEPAEWRPFRFKGLERISPLNAQLLRRLRWVMQGDVGAIGDAVRARLKELLEDEVTLSLESSQVISPTHLRKLVGEPTFLAVLSSAPHKPRALLEIELGLAHAVVDRLLGGEGESVGHRALSDIEEGVVSFAVLEVLKLLSRGLNPSLFKLRLDGVAKSPAEAVERLGPETSLISAVFRAGLGPQMGFIRWFLPASAVASAQRPAPDPERLVKRAAEVKQRMRRLAAVRTWMRAEIGSAEISGSELSSLQVGDVVVVEELTARPDQGLGGTARLKVGAGWRGWAEAELLLEDDEWKAKVLGFRAGEGSRLSREEEEAALEKDEERRRDENTDVVAVPLERENKRVSEEADGVDLLNDIPLQLAIELARIQVTAEEIAELKVGQLIELGRTSGEPVELSVNGKIVARGELVEIEGRLGVRLLALLG